MSCCSSLPRLLGFLVVSVLSACAVMLSRVCLVEGNRIPGLVGRVVFWIVLASLVVFVLRLRRSGFLGCHPPPRTHTPQPQPLPPTAIHPANKTNATDKTRKTNMDKTMRRTRRPRTRIWQCLGLVVLVCLLDFLFVFVSSVTFWAAVVFVVFTCLFV